MIEWEYEDHLDRKERGMNTAEIKEGMRVRDKFKAPRPGEPPDANVGKVVEVTKDRIVVDFRYGWPSVRVFTRTQASHLLEILNHDD